MDGERSREERWTRKSVANLERMVREDLSEKGTFEQRSEGSGRKEPGSRFCVWAVEKTCANTGMNMLSMFRD